MIWLSNIRTDIGPFAIVPLWLIKRGISSVALHLYATLAAVYADREGKSWPSRSSLAETIGCSVDTVDRSVKELVKVGALVKERRMNGDGGQSSNGYTLRFGRPGEGENGTEAGAAKRPQTNDTPRPQPCGTPRPQTNDTNHNHIEPEKDCPATSAGRTGAAPAQDRRHTPREVFVDFEARWKRAYPAEHRYPFTGRHAAEAKQLLLALPPAELARRMDRFFAMDDRYYAEQRHAFHVFSRDIVKFTDAEPVPASSSPPPADVIDADDETAAVIRELRRRRESKKGGINGTEGTAPELPR